MGTKVPDFHSMFFQFFFKEVSMMKKFLIGIVTLVAAVMLTSPAFASYLPNPITVDPVDSADNPVEGKFWFWTDVENGTLSKLIGAEDTTDQLPGYVPESWGPVVSAESYPSLDGNEWGTTDAIFTFKNPVQIVSAKWDGVQYAFRFEDQVKVMAWITDRDMSNIYTYNAVPVPAAVWLLGSGVLGLVAIRRRRS
jgi:hypothetical protein